jgi:excisionase family DNA binding protein
MQLTTVPQIMASARSGSLMEASEVAKWLGVSIGWVRDHATKKEPRLNSVRVGKLLRFRPEDVEEFIRKRRF